MCGFLLELCRLYLLENMVPSFLRANNCQKLPGWVEPHGQLCSLCWKLVWFGLLWVMCMLTSPWWVPPYSHPLPLALTLPRPFSLIPESLEDRIQNTWLLGADSSSLSFCTWDCCGLCAGCHLWQTEAYLTNHSFLSTVYENKLHP